MVDLNEETVARLVADEELDPERPRSMSCSTTTRWSSGPGRRPSCGRRITELHHIVKWGWGGETNLDVGVPLCLGHHHLVHEGGWSIRYDATTGTTTLRGPDGQRIESPCHRSPGPSPFAQVPRVPQVAAASVTTTTLPLARRSASSRMASPAFSSGYWAETWGRMAPSSQ